jgi:uncharacterized Fe-S radical SAM superfamily protein PflX
MDWKEDLFHYFQVRRRLMDVVGIFILVCVVSCVFCLAIDFVVGRRKYRRFVAKLLERMLLTKGISQLLRQ